VLTRIAVGFSAGLLEFFPEVQFIVAHIGGGEIVLGREAAINRPRLGDAGPVDHLIDADCADALAIEQLARGRRGSGRRPDRTFPQIYRGFSSFQGFPMLPRGRA